MHPNLPRRRDLDGLLALALPIVVVQVGLMAMGVVDAIMVGHVSPAALAGAALGNLYFFAFAGLAMGTLMVLDPIVSQAVGAGDREGAARGVQRGLALALILSVVIALALLPAHAVLTALRQPLDVIPLAAGFVRVSILGVVPFLGFFVLRQTLQASHRTGPIVFTIVIANLVNGGLNWVLVFGNLGSPALGVTGSAIATVLSRWFMFGCLVALAARDILPLLVPIQRAAIGWRALAHMLGLGLPIGFSVLLEFGAFAAVALLMGRLGTVSMAGHQVAINLASFTFMVPLGVGSAAAVRVGHAVGSGDALAGRRAAIAALAIGAGFMCASALMFRLVPGPLARLYSTDPSVMAVAAALIPIAGVFQIFDGLQVVAGGILRGLGDTRAPLIVSLVGFWLFGMPISLVLGFRMGGGPVGLWWGLVAGLAAVAVFLLVRVRVRMSRAMVRIVVDPIEARERGSPMGA